MNYFLFTFLSEYTMKSPVSRDFNYLEATFLADCVNLIEFQSTVFEMTSRNYF